MTPAEQLAQRILAGGLPMLAAYVAEVTLRLDEMSDAAIPPGNAPSVELEKVLLPDGWCSRHRQPSDCVWCKAESANDLAGHPVAPPKQTPLEELRRVPGATGANAERPGYSFQGHSAEQWHDWLFEERERANQWLADKHDMQKERDTLAARLQQLTGELEGVREQALRNNESFDRERDKLTARVADLEATEASLASSWNAEISAHEVMKRELAWEKAWDLHRKVELQAVVDAAREWSDADLGVLAAMSSAYVAMTEERLSRAKQQLRLALSDLSQPSKPEPVVRDTRPCVRCWMPRASCECAEYAPGPSVEPAPVAEDE